jgi:hypothetical protein
LLHSLSIANEHARHAGLSIVSVGENIGAREISIAPGLSPLTDHPLPARLPVELRLLPRSTWL